MVGRSSLVAIVLAFFMATGLSAQTNGTIDAGTTVSVRTNEAITADSGGEVFSGTVDRDVVNRNGTIAVPKGSDVELVVKDTGNNQVALDLGAITINGQRYSVQADESVVDDSTRKEGVGANKRTGKYVGGGAVLGAIVGAIAGGGKGAAVGAGAGAAAGAGIQVLTRGQRVNVPAESLLTFRLQQPLQTGFSDTRQSRRFKPTYNGDNTSNNTAAYRAGVVAGRSDADRNLPMNMRTTRWTSAQDRRDYEAGYDSGYRGNQQSVSGNAPVYNGGSGSSINSGSSVHVGDDNNITWQAPGTARVYVQADGKPLQLFAEGASGTQAAPWIEPGHVYVFILRDLNGNELARDRVDLRRSRGYGRNR